MWPQCGEYIGGGEPYAMRHIAKVLSSIPLVIAEIKSLSSNAFRKK
jgi:hypothetical protein